MSFSPEARRGKEGSSRAAVVEVRALSPRTKPPLVAAGVFAGVL